MLLLHKKFPCVFAAELQFYAQTFAPVLYFRNKNQETMWIDIVSIKEHNVQDQPAFYGKGIGRLAIQGLNLFRECKVFS